MENIWRTWAEIDLDALQHNVKEIRKQIRKSTRLLAVIKADAYGHGAVGIVQELLNCGVTDFAVASVNEAVQLRQAGIQGNLLILGYTPDENLLQVVKAGVQQTVYSLSQAKRLQEIAAAQGRTIGIHLKVDTGMHRLGFADNEESADAIYIISQMSNLSIEGIFSHFAGADQEDLTGAEKQLNRFQQFLKRLDEKEISIPLRHMANSGAIVTMKEAEYDMVRPGLLLFGHFPSDVCRLPDLNLIPVMTVKSRIAHLQIVPTGEGVSYGPSYRAESPVRIATVPIGYADGFSRILSNKPLGLMIHGEIAPLVGNICMDYCMVDVSQVAEAAVGDEVIIYGKEHPVEQFAEAMGTINYEVLCLLHKRIPRVYIKSGETIEIQDSLLGE
jgi:alanine racemase